MLSGGLAAPCRRSTHRRSPPRFPPRCCSCRRSRGRRCTSRRSRSAMRSVSERSPAACTSGKVRNGRCSHIHAAHGCVTIVSSPLRMLSLHSGQVSQLPPQSVRCSSPLRTKSKQVGHELQTPPPQSTPDSPAIAAGASNENGLPAQEVGRKNYPPQTHPGSGSHPSSWGRRQGRTRLETAARNGCYCTRGRSLRQGPV